MALGYHMVIKKYIKTVLVFVQAFVCVVFLLIEIEEQKSGYKNATVHLTLGKRWGIYSVEMLKCVQSFHKP